MKLVVTDVHGLTALHSNLDFLSVFHCDHVNPSTKLPALQIASELTEEQLIVALRVYMDRDQILESVLNELFQIYRLGNEETNSDYTEGLHLILDALSIHRHVRTLQTSGTAALFYAIRHTSNSMSLTLKRRVVEVILDILDNYNDEAIIVRNSCLSFCQLEIPKDVVFAYSRMVIVLVRILNTHSGGILYYF
jgi:Zyg-11 family protein